MAAAICGHEPVGLRRPVTRQPPRPEQKSIGACSKLRKSAEDLQPAVADSAAMIAAREDQRRREQNSTN
jgi:hypothetical protein